MAAAKRPKGRAEKRQERSVTVLPADPTRGAGRLDGLLLDGRRLDMAIGDRLLGATFARTMDGPNTITLDIYDRDRVVLKSGILGARAMSKVARIELDGLGYVATGVSKTADTLSIPFEDEVVTAAKRHGRDKPLRVSRNRMTRAGFCASMFREAGIPVLVLDENVAQPIGKAARAAKAQTTKSARSTAKGLPGSGLTVKGVAPDGEQRRVMGAALGEAQRLKASDRPTLALVLALIQENSVRASGGMVDHTSLGPLQLLASTAAGLHVNPRDTVAVTRLFLTHGFWKYAPKGAIALARENPGWTAGQIAQACQGSAHPEAYDHWHDEGLKWVKAGGGADVSDATTTTRTKQQVFERAKGESTWTAAKRLLDEVTWRLFVREGVVIIAHDLALMRAAPSLQLTERSDFVESLDFEWHRALKVGEMTAAAYVERYQADPGEVMQVTDLPELEQNWLLWSTSQALLSTNLRADINLKRPQAPKAEPAAETVTTTSSGTGDGGSGAAAGGSVADRLRAECKRISDTGATYSHAGHGNVPLSKVTPSPGGLDCSSSCSLALYRAGLFGDRKVAIVSGEFAASYGKPGRGKEFTVWANGGHVFILGRGWRFDTGGPRLGKGRGPRLFEGAGEGTRPTGGFTPRHFPGH